MERQLILAIGREYGSGGHDVAKLLSARFGLKLYDRELLALIAQENQVDEKDLEWYDEQRSSRLLFRRVNGFDNSPNANIALMQFDYIRRRAEEGESFVVVGRCGEEILRGRPGLISVFILADREFRLTRVMAERGIARAEADALIVRTDRRRRAYHDQHCGGRWGDARSYDLCINSARLGIEGTADLLERYIKAKNREEMPEGQTW